MKEGKKSALGEVNYKSKDIFRLKIGNVPPQQKVSIEISYLQELKLSCNTFYKLEIEKSVFPKFVDTNSKSKGKDFEFNFKINLRTSRKLLFSQSSSHKLQLVSQNDAKT